MSLKEPMKKKLTEQRDELERAKETENELSQEVEIELENSMLHAEIERLQAVATSSRESTG